MEAETGISKRSPKQKDPFIGMLVWVKMFVNGGGEISIGFTDITGATYSQRTKTYE